MRSLRLQLLLGTATGSAAVLFVSGVVLYALLEQTLRSEFDRSLAVKARALAALIEFDSEGLESDLAAAPLPEFAPAEQAEYYQIWLPDGGVFGRSPSLGSGDLARSAVTSDLPVFRDARLPDGRPGRIVQLQVVPRHEPRFRTAAAAATVTLGVARETSGLAATLARIRALMTAVAIAAVALSTLALAWLVHRNLRPVARLSGQIADVGERDLRKRIAGAGTPRELSPIVDRLNELLSRLEAAFERERRFTGDVAHELRTPLAGLRARLELALTRERTPQEYRSALSDSLEVSRQMHRMVENLLHLARADAGLLETRRERVDVTALADECWKAQQERAAARGLRIEWERRAPRAVESDSDALRLIVRNIIDNAVTHATRGGSIQVTTAHEDHGLVLRVSNDTSLAPTDAPRVFDRFWQADPARERHGDARCGLGLPLCKALVELLGGSITAAVSGGMFVVSLRLPAARAAAASSAGTSPG